MGDVTDFSVVTGAFGFTGRYIASRLLANGEIVKTITGHPGRHNPFGDRVSVAPFQFDELDRLVAELSGASTVYNTYWVRFSHGDVTFDRAVANIKTLIGAARDAGVQRFVHVSITNPSLDSPYPYFKGKAQVEQALKESGLSHAIIRPAFVFGEGDVLLNNIAWLLRRFPFFVVPGHGNYRMQPVYVEDVARIAVKAAAKEEDLIIDAVGPETYTFNELVYLLADAIGSRVRVLHLPPRVALFLSGLIGRMLKDVVLTRDEVGGLSDNLLVSDGPSTASGSLREWLRKEDNTRTLGARYASELDRHYRPQGSVLI